MGNVSVYVHLMQGLGWVMILLFLHVFFAPFRRLQRAVAASDTAVAARQLEQIRRFVGLNLVIGLIVLVIGAIGLT